MEGYNKFEDVFGFHSELPYKQQKIDEILRNRHALEKVLFIDRLLTSMSIEIREINIHKQDILLVRSHFISQHLSSTHLERPRISATYIDKSCPAIPQIITSNQ